MKVRGDLHIHTCLSPCGDNEMLPETIVNKAIQKGLGIIAICDHNSSANTQAVIDAAVGTNVTVIPGMEVTSQEEVHTLALFETSDKALNLEKYIHAALKGENNPDKFGEQLIVSKDGAIKGNKRIALFGAPDISLEEIVRKIKSLGGIAIASHIDREGYGVIGQLGFIPEGIDYDALEISSRMSLEEARKRFGEYARFHFITSSDAHFPDDIGRASTEFELKDASFESLKNYFKERKNS